MNMISNIQLSNDLSEDPLLVMASFEFDHAFYNAVHAELTHKMKAYDPEGFSPHLIAHQERVATNAFGFLTHDTPTRKAFPEDLAYNISKAFGWHDVEKLLDKPETWRIHDKKPDISHLTPDEIRARRAERFAHALRDGEILKRAVRKVLSDWEQAELTPDQAKMINLSIYIESYHHEVLDGSGPHGMIAAQQSPILRTLAIIDTIDGKIKTQKSLTEMFDDMSGEKHKGKYDPTTVREYQAYYAGIHSLAPSSGLANPRYL